MSFSLPGSSAPASGRFVPVEHVQTTVRFDLTALRQGTVGTPAPISGYVCAVSHAADDCRPGVLTAAFDNLQPGQVLSGAVSWIAPAADEKAAAIVRFCQTAPALPSNGMACQPAGEETVFMPVAARYVVSIQGFTIAHTREPHKSDIVTISLLGGVFGSAKDTVLRCGSEPTTSCTQGMQQSEHGIGAGYMLNDVSIGPFALVPGQEKGLRLGYVVANQGADYGDFAGYNAMKAEVSDILNRAVGSAGGGTTSQPSPSFGDQINGLAWHGCDGPTAMLVTSILDGRTPAGALDPNGLRVQTDAGHGQMVGMQSGPAFTSQAGCGDSPRYEVTWKITRTSWAPD